MEVQINRQYKNETRNQLVVPIQATKYMVTYQVTQATTDNPMKEFKCSTDRFLNLYKIAK